MTTSGPSQEFPPFIPLHYPPHNPEPLDQLINRLDAAKIPAQGYFAEHMHIHRFDLPLRYASYPTRLVVFRNQGECSTDLPTSPAELDSLLLQESLVVYVRIWAPPDMSWHNVPEDVASDLLTYCLYTLGMRELLLRIEGIGCYADTLLVVGRIPTTDAAENVLDQMHNILDKLI